MFAIYVFEDYPVSSAIGFAWPMGAAIAGGIGACVIVGPLLTVWSFWEIFVSNEPDNANFAGFVFGLPSTIVIMTAGIVTAVNGCTGTRLWVRPLTCLLAPLAYAAVMIAASGFFA